ncbi:aminotransferase class I/II-fold pyridoxal phosphate-dependent enzyme [bacterium]|nr:aminotransferase class I/II-fold pyridoxal phosphate-dependent enzyme [bacterium]
MSIESRNNSVPSFESVDSLIRGINNRDNYRENSLYPRDGNVSLGEAEAEASKFARVNEDEILLYSSGMAAVTSALEIALEDKLAKGAVLACPPALYSQTNEFIQKNLRNRGVEIRCFNPQDKDNIEHNLGYAQPEVIFAETVGNSPNVPVLDVEHLLAVCNSLEKEPIVILDNTLPLSTGLPLGEQLSSENKVIVVESGTKAYTANTELSGFLYSKNEELLSDARALRRSSGNLPGVASVNLITELLPDSLEEFDERNERLFKNAAELALYLSIAEHEGAPFKVVHPGIHSHPDHTYAYNFLPRGASPVLFLKADLEIGQFDLAKALWDNETVRENAELGQSFGFDTARILPDLHNPSVRIASGAETDVHTLGKALIEAASDIEVEELYSS